MDLLSAKKQIAVTSKKDPKTKYYLNVDDEGEVTVSKEYDKDASGYCYRNGSEIALDAAPPTQAKPEKNQSVKKQTTKESSADANATNMKNKAKRATKPVEAVKEKTVPRGNNMFLTEAEWKKVDALCAKKELSFSAFSRGLVQAAIK